MEFYINDEYYEGAYAQSLTQFIIAQLWGNEMFIVKELLELYDVKRCQWITNKIMNFAGYLYFDYYNDDEFIKFLWEEHYEMENDDCAMKEVVFRALENGDAEEIFDNIEDIKDEIDVLVLEWTDIAPTTHHYRFVAIIIQL